ncbi:PREDICTED: uncharacterized protein LOC107126116 [Gekko japonicus]|uniref:Uncharacterized protein LOC107111959 n=1 Tax=Gekko japonicus TaxID=146911 RepID=A0ABM1L726_GEKJA|nr:PREDICTED: uncharacterized protein LOC107111959 [Gekko japonicus]XP_015270970.1 PREDICTED: uncharacterized protein LOC107114061 [Gekko japonicus]XP_015275078.1 PREDICTED: uncharacterized protein LOC107117463 [Gekko japonicus]XP_015279967.1 PREDICTED: uncharacterized protein LOC107121558 [Gekko japonicus]XP_015281763.1 PREDICTED: uncharacterized protein LOC107123100 [Gekko japonicus]XP_015283177.1 PREDICTED: uncharacterized protein LOC107124272 [Gekko japonicus]XP_015285113.1 PREDICTED: unc
MPAICPTLNTPESRPQGPQVTCPPPEDDWPPPYSAGPLPPPPLPTPPPEARVTRSQTAQARAAQELAAQEQLQELQISEALSPSVPVSTIYPSLVDCLATASAPEPETPVTPIPKTVLKKNPTTGTWSPATHWSPTSGLSEMNPFKVPVGKSQETGNLATVCPLRQVPAGADGIMRWVYSPFSTVDLCNWRTQTTPYSEDPRPMTDLFTTIMATHAPTWRDCSQLLTALLTSEEKRKVMAAAKKTVENRVPADQQPNAADWVRARFPDIDPNWDPNVDADRGRSEEYRTAILLGLQEAGKKPMNMAKLREVIQEPTEPPYTFLERLYKAYRLYTPFDPEEEANRTMVNASFVSQAAPDIRRKLQKLEGFQGMNVSQLIEVAQKVFVNRDKEEKKEEEAKHRRKAAILAAVIQGHEYDRPSPTSNLEPRGPRTLGRDQCAYCRADGHWKNECPNRQSRLRGRGGSRGQGRGQSFNHLPRGQVNESRYSRTYPAGKSEDGFVGMAGMNYDD